MRRTSCTTRLNWSRVERRRWHGNLLLIDETAADELGQPLVQLSEFALQVDERDDPAVPGVEQQVVGRLAKTPLDVPVALDQAVLGAIFEFREQTLGHLHRQFLFGDVGEDNGVDGRIQALRVETGARVADRPPRELQVEAEALGSVLFCREPQQTIAGP